MKTEVVFRKITFFEDKENSIVEVNAIFPKELKAVVSGERIYEAYAHIGQHCEIHEDFLNKSKIDRHKAENASYEEYKDLAKELESIGYNLKILNK